MAKLTLTSIAADYSSKATINANWDLIEAAIENTLSRDGTAPNTMSADIDMNGNKVTNVGDPTADGDLITLGYANAHFPLAAATSACLAAQAAAESAQTAAETAQTAAETAQTAAETAETNVIALYDAFDDRYLGSKASDPTLDNDGNPLLTGALYWNTTSSEMRVYNGSAWVAVVAGSAGGLNGAAWYRTTNQSIVDSTWTTFLPTGTEWNVGGWSVGSGQVTVPSGVTHCRIHGLITFAANGTGERRVAIWKNGSSSHRGLGATQIEYSPSASVNCTLPHKFTYIIPVTAGDYFEVKVWQNSGGALDVYYGNGASFVEVEGWNSP